MQAAAAGDSVAIGALVDEFGPQVASYARRHQALDHESVANGAMADAVRSLPNFRGTDRRAFRSYVFRIVKRRIVDEFRKQASRPDVIAGDGDEMLGDFVDLESSTFDDEVAGHDAAQELLAQLTDDQREVVEMRVLTGLSVRETAAHTGRSVTAVKAMQRRALLSLRAIVTAAAILLVGLIVLRILNNLGNEPIVVVDDPAGQGEGEPGRQDEEGSVGQPQSLVVESVDEDGVAAAPSAIQGPTPVDGDGSTLVGAPLTGPVAFPGASGWAAETTTGGRGGRVVIVNSLENVVDPGDNLLTFREAMTEIDEPRIIVFSVAGTIDYRSGASVPGSQMILNGSDSDVTVACQSAPAPGVTFVGEGIRFSSHVSNVIMRHCRFRNSAPVDEGSASNNSCLRVSGTRSAAAPNRYVFDHISCMWATSGSIEFAIPAIAQTDGPPIRDVSVSNAILADGAVLPPALVGENGQTSTTDGLSCSSAIKARPIERCSLVGNFIAHYQQRSAKMWGVDGAELTNNIVYNFAAVGLQAKARPTMQNHFDGSILGNLVQYGPDSKPSTDEIFRPIDLSGNTAANASIELSDNQVAQAGQQPETVESPLYDNENSPSIPAVTGVGEINSMARRGSDHLRCLGASRPQRDSHDQRVIDEFHAGVGPTGVEASPVRDLSEYPTTAVPQQWRDEDQDGMPDSWERKLGLDDPKANDLSSVYTNVEVFLNGQAQCPRFSVDVQQGVSFPVGAPVEIPFATNWQLWSDGQAIEVCVDGQCRAYVDPDGDQSFEISDLSTGDHTATFTLLDPSGFAVGEPERFEFNVR